ncbi:MAG: Yip1 family protein [Pseudomonadota bacterium]
MSNITGKVRPLREIWFAPELTVSRVAHEKPGYRIIVLPVLASFAIWPGLLLAGFDPDEPVGLFWQALLSFNFTVELPLQFVTAWMLFASSRRFGGRASFNAIVSALAWSRLPIAILGVISIPLFIVGEALADALRGVVEPWVRYVGFIATLEIIAISWWILVKGLASVQGYSTRKATLHFVACSAALAGVAVSLTWLAVGTEETLDVLFYGAREHVGIWGYRP